MARIWKQLSDTRARIGQCLRREDSYLVQLPLGTKRGWIDPFVDSEVAKLVDGMGVWIDRDNIERLWARLKSDRIGRRVF